MAEGVYRALRIGREGGIGDEVDTRGAERDKGGFGRRDADAGGAGRVVARAPRHDHVRRQAKVRGHGRQHAAAGLAALHKAGHVGASKVRGLEHGVRPGAAGHVHPQGACGIGHVRHRLTGQQQPDVVLGQQHPRNLPEHFRLVLFDPQQLGRREPRHRDVAGDPAAIGGAPLELGALRMAAAIVPQDGRPQHPVARIEQSGTMHLARQTESAHGPVFGWMGGADFRQRRDGGAPPVLRVLLRPQRLRARDRHGAAGLTDDALRRIHQDDLDLGRADIDSEIHSVDSSASDDRHRNGNSHPGLPPGSMDCGAGPQ